MNWTGSVNASNIDFWIAEDRKQRDAYYKDGTNTWGDDFYDEVHDAVIDYLDEYIPNHPFLDEVGSDYDGDSEWDVKEHEYPMGSLNKCKLLEDFEEWHKKYSDSSFVLQEKLDGISIALTYDNGYLIKALTRKTGTKGEDITRNVQKMKGLPKQRLSYLGHVVFRGEILLYHSDFEKVNKVRTENEEKIYKNPRNAAAGMAKDQKGTYCSFLTVQIYDVMNMKQMLFGDEIDAIQFINAEGFIAVANTILFDIKDINAVYEKYVESDRVKLDWDIDGMVIKTATWHPTVDKEWKKPKTKIAWKFPPQRAQTTIIRIEASSASRITPVAVFEPVECGGVTIQRASLANWKLCLEKNVGPGAKVEISRRNDVIPYVESVLKPGETPIVPKTCPTCGASTEWELNTSGEETVYLICSNLECPNKLVKLIHKWLNIHEAKGVGSAFVEMVVKKKMVTSLIDFLNFPYLTQYQAILMGMDGYGHRKMKKINSEIEKTCNTTVWKFFSGLNFKGIGSTRIQIVVDAMPGPVSVQSFIDFVLSPKLFIDNIDSFGDGLAPLLRSQLDKNLDLIDKLQGVVNISDTGEQKTLTDKFKDMSFCFTVAKGEPSILKRKEAEGMVKQNGGKTSGVSKNLTYLVTNDVDGSTGKCKKARDVGVKIITEEAFLDMLGIEKEPEDKQILFGLPEDKKEDKEPPKKDTQVLFSIDDL